MSMEPIQRQMNNPVVGGLNVPALLQDTITGLTFIQLNVPNTVLDMYNGVEPAAAADFYTYELQKNSISTGRTFFSTAMNTGSAGRAAVGPVKLICSIHASLKVLKFPPAIVIEFTLWFKRRVTAFAAS